MYSDTIVAVVLVALLVFFSLDFDRQYGSVFHTAARHPFARFLSGLGVVYLATLNPLYAVLGLVIVFFWIADVNLMSHVQLGGSSASSGSVGNIAGSNSSRS